MIPINDNEKNAVIAVELEGAKWLYAPESDSPRRFLVMPGELVLTSERCDDFPFQPCADMEVPIAWEWCCGVPNYCTDKDAANRAALKLPEGNMASSNPSDYPRWTFVWHLCRLAQGVKLFDNGEFVGNDDSLFALATASPAAVTDALLLTLGYHVNMEMSLA